MYESCDARANSNSCMVELKAELSKCKGGRAIEEGFRVECYCGP